MRGSIYIKREKDTNRSLTKKTFSNVIIWGMHDKGYLIIIAIQNIGFIIRRRWILDLVMLRKRKRERKVLVIGSREERKKKSIP